MGVAKKIKINTFWAWKQQTVTPRYQRNKTGLWAKPLKRRLVYQYKPQRPIAGAVVVSWGWEVRVWASHKSHGSRNSLPMMMKWKDTDHCPGKRQWSFPFYQGREPSIRNQNPKSVPQVWEVTNSYNPVGQGTPNQKINLETFQNQWNL